MRVRQALNYAVDKEAIVKSILRGNGSIANSPLPLMAHHNDATQAVSVRRRQGQGAARRRPAIPNGFKANMLVAGGDATARQVGGGAAVRR